MPGSPLKAEIARVGGGVQQCLPSGYFIPRKKLLYSLRRYHFLYCDMSLSLRAAVPCKSLSGGEEAAKIRIAAIATVKISKILQSGSCNLTGQEDANNDEKKYKVHRHELKVKIYSLLFLTQSSHLSPSTLRRSTVWLVWIFVELMSLVWGISTSRILKLSSL